VPVASVLLDGGIYSPLI